MPVNQMPIKIRIYKNFEPKVSKVPITQQPKKWALPHKFPRKSLTSNVQECEQTDREQAKSLQINERTVRSHQTFASVQAPLRTTKFNLGSHSSILLR